MDGERGDEMGNRGMRKKMEVPVSVLVFVGLGTGGARYQSSGCSESSKSLDD